MNTIAVDQPPTSAASSGPLSPEDLLRMPDGHRYELVGGQLVERNMGAESSGIAAVILFFIGQHVRAQKLGKVCGPDCGLQIFPDAPTKVRFADGSFIGWERLPDRKLPRGHRRVAPDLAIEVISPNDTAEEVETKRLEYLRAGVKLVWVVYPDNRTVHVHRADAQPTVLTVQDELTGDAVLPGFRCRVAELFEDV